MSKDLTPEECLLFEKMICIANNGFSLWDFKETLKWSYKGEEFPWYSPEELETCKAFPFLGKLYNDFFKLYKEAACYPNGTAFIKTLDEELKCYVENGKEAYHGFLIEWYHGKLDKNFYYSKVNDRLFFSEVMEHISKEADKDDPITSDEKETSPGRYRKTSDGWFDFYINVDTGEKKFTLGLNDILVED